jgi:hypothetical protein
LLCHPPRQRLRLYSDPDLLYPTEEAAGTSGRFLLDPDLDPDDDLDLDPEKASSSHDLGLRRTLAQLLPPLPAGEPARLPRRSRRSSRLFGRPRRLLRGEDEHVQGSRRPRSLSLRMSAADQALVIQPLRSRTFPIPVPTLSPIPSLYLSSLHIDLALFYPSPSSTLRPLLPFPRSLDGPSLLQARSPFSIPVVVFCLQHFLFLFVNMSSFFVSLLPCLLVVCLVGSSMR